MKMSILEMNFKHFHDQAHGAEILCSKYDVEDINLASNLDVALKSDTRWHRFVEALSQKGYFKVGLYC